MTTEPNDPDDTVEIPANEDVDPGAEAYPGDGQDDGSDPSDGDDDGPRGDG
jgi:hypothetical protein